MTQQIESPDGGERSASRERQKVGFGAQIPGMKTAPVEHQVRSKTRAEMAKTPEAWKSYNELSRTMRIVNRAQKGPMTGRPFACAFNSEVWPENADIDDETTWLQPGEYMDVPKDVALHFVGNVWDPKLPNRQDIILRYGDLEYQPTEWGQGSGRMPKAVPVGPPPIPDLLVCELDGRSQPKSDYKPIYEMYTKGLIYNRPLIKNEAELVNAPVESFERVKTPA